MKVLNLLAVAILATQLTLAQNTITGLVDTNMKYAKSIYVLGETQDCSIRALAEIYNIRYAEAREYLTKWGREPETGIVARDMLIGMNKDFPGTIEQDYSQFWSPITPFVFATTVAESGKIYLLIADAHVFVIEEDHKQDWLIKGNTDDVYTKILGYIVIDLKDKEDE
jgi:hypothetical protein